MNTIKQVWSSLDGKKTHIIAGVIAVLNIAVAFGYISPAHLVQINLVLGALGLTALRSGIAKSNS